MFPPEDLQRARSALESVGLAEYEERLVRNLSGGQKQRVNRPGAGSGIPALLCDEPTANLDLRTADEILGWIVELAGPARRHTRAYLHDARLARKHCTRIVALREGRTL